MVHKMGHGGPMLYNERGACVSGVLFFVSQLKAGSLGVFSLGHVDFSLQNIAFLMRCEN